MKQITLNLIALLFTGLVFGQSKSGAELPALDFMETKFDFGKIAQGRPVYHNFVVKNRSSDPIRISNVLASCGCTTPEWSQDPIAPGAETVIRVGYNSAAEGAFSRDVLVQYGDKQVSLIISGNVYKTPATSAPLNTSISLLRQINHSNK